MLLWAFGGLSVTVGAGALLALGRLTVALACLAVGAAMMAGAWATMLYAMTRK